MGTKHKVQIYDTPQLLSKAACNLIIETVKESIAARGRFSLVLSGGHTPETMFSLLAQPEYSRQIDWKNTFIFWGDERCVPLNDKQNNSFVARTLLLDKIEIPPANIFITPVNLPPAEAANKYEAMMKYFFGNNPPVFDLILLGLGENGHTASLFPGTDVLHEHSRWVKEVYVEEQKMFRVTMTAPLINKARNIVFLVSGKSKAEILKTIFTGPYQPDKYPAQLIKSENGKLYWYLDKDAAGQNA